MDDGAPPWFAPVALHTRVHRGRCATDVPGDVPKESRDPRVPARFQSIMLGTPGDAAVFVLKAASEAVVDSLQPSSTRGVPGLAVRRENLSRLRLIQFLIALGEHAGGALFSQLAVEVQRVPAKDPKHAERLRPEILDQNAPKIFFSKTEFKDAQPPVRTVTSLDQLVATPRA